MRSKILAFGLAVSLVCLSVPPSHAAADTELLELKNTILNLVDELVNQGVITADAAEAMKAKAAIKAREQAAQQAIAAGETEDIPPAPPSQAAGAPASVVRVPYVPEFIKDEIRAEVREELRQDVTDDVVAVAREEKWGTPDALPDWVSRITLDGDVRIRMAGLLLDENNSDTIPDFEAINDAGGAAAAGDQVFLNTRDNISNMQARVRAGLRAAVTENFSAVFRLATSNDRRPTSRNQSLGDFNRPFEIYVDQLYLQWESGSDWDPYLQLRAGRLPNPFMRTELLWDNDLIFDGITASFRTPLYGETISLFTNLGGFTLLAEEANNIDGGTFNKTWWGAQLGTDLQFTENVRLTLAGAYFGFNNTVGQRNDFNSTSKDWTAPEFLTKGNTMFDIRNDLDPDTQLFAMASEFELVNAQMELRYTGFAPVHVALRGDYVQNIGYDEDDVAQRVGVAVEERNTGWGTELLVGWPEVRGWGQWRLRAAYRQLERDAVIDAFPDSNFHAGGTDGEGWIAAFWFGLTDNIFVRARYFSANEIDGAPAGFAEPFVPLAIDVWQIGLNAQF